MTLEYIIQNPNTIRIMEYDGQQLFHWYFFYKDVWVVDGQNHVYIYYLFPKQELQETYSKISNNNKKSVVINPTFTIAAYDDNGFYDYYKDMCDESCLTVTVNNAKTIGSPSSHVGLGVLEFLKYDVLSDYDVHMNPSILDSYDKVIVLHNEYVTKEMFDAFENHPNVIYLYPNALYAEVDYNSIEDTITLVRGHGYPTSGIKNGFDWKNENTHPFEYDMECLNWEFYKIDNGWMLNCYPEKFIRNSFELLKALKDL